MPKLKLRVLSEEESSKRGVLTNPDADAGFVFFKGDGNWNLLCGQCDRKLVKHVARGGLGDRLKNAAVKCPRCGAVNDLGSAPN